MMEKAFMKDPVSDEWVECSDPRIIRRDMSEMESRIIGHACESEKIPLIWCRRHGTFEMIAQDTAEKTVSECGCEFTGSYVRIDEELDECHCRSYTAGASRWRVYQRAPGMPIMIAKDMACVRFGHRRPWSRDIYLPEITLLDWKVRSIIMDVQKERFLSGGVNPLESYFDSGDSFPDLPETIVELVFQMLLKEAEARYGIQPYIEDDFTGYEKLENFMRTPLNRSVNHLKPIIKNRRHSLRIMHDLFPKNQQDYLEPICRFLGIENPPEELKHASRNSIIPALNYKLYTEMGFSDVAAISLVWNNTNFFGKSLYGLLYSKKDKTTFWWKNNAEFIAWMLHHCDEIKLAKMLADTYYAGEDGPDRDKMISSMIHHKMLLPESFIEYFVSQGFTADVNRHLIQTILNASYRYVNIRFPMEAADLETRINGFDFRLVRHTLYLRRISEAMDSNIEQEYADVIDGRFIVFTVDYSGKYIAYIKVEYSTDHRENKFRFEVIDLRGEHDKNVPLGTKLLCYYWAASHGFAGAERFLWLRKDERARYHKTRFVAEAIRERSVVYDDYRLEELLEFPAYTRNDSYYRILESRLRSNTDTTKMSLPPWKSISDERKYLSLLLPWTSNLFEDIEQGSPGAENVLGYLYESDQFIPRNREKALYWFHRSAGSGYIPAMHNLAMTFLTDGNASLAKKWYIRAAKRGSETAFHWCRQHVSPVEYAIIA